jgi:hypothetical protein
MSQISCSIGGYNRASTCLLVYGSCESDPAVHTSLVGRQERMTMHHHYHKPKQDHTLMIGIIVQYHIKNFVSHYVTVSQMAPRGKLHDKFFPVEVK